MTSGARISLSDRSGEKPARTAQSGSTPRPGSAPRPAGTASTLQPAGPIRTETRLRLACAVAFCLNSLDTWLLNVGIFPATSTVFPLARELQTLVGLVLGLAVLWLAMRRPHVLRPAAVGALACILSVGGAVLLLVPAIGSSPAGVCVALSMSALASGWMAYPLGVALGHLGPTRQTCAALSAGLLAGVLFSSILPAPNLVAGAILRCLGLLAQGALLIPATIGAIQKIAASGGAEEIDLASPSSLLPPTSKLYVAILVFSAAFGFALAYRIDQFTPVTGAFQLLAVGAVMVWFLASRDPVRVTDGLFAASLVLVVAGLVLTLVPAAHASPLPNGLLYAGSRCFTVLSATVLASLCHRNPAGALVFLAAAGIASTTGTFVGADTGHLVNALTIAGSGIGQEVVALLVVALFAYLAFGMRGFSFAQTIQGVTPYVKPNQMPDRTGAAQEEFVRACREAARSHGLTPREAEVMALLARGNGGHKIEEELTLSYNTVKTHVKRVYRKLDVHSQQELIDLVASYDSRI